MYCKIILLQTSREDAVLLRSRMFEFAFKISVKYPQKQTYKYFNILGLDSYRTMTPKLSQFSKFATKISTFENTQKHMNSGVQISLFHKKKGQKSLETAPSNYWQLIIFLKFVSVKKFTIGYVTYSNAFLWSISVISMFL